jgi:hypothetical protein
MSDLDSIVSVNITADSKTVSRTGFGTVLCLCHHDAWAENYRLYSSLAEVADDFSSHETAYRMAAAAFAQDPAPTTVVVGRMGGTPAFTRVVTVTSNTEGDIVKLSVIAPTTGAVTDISYTIPAAQSLTQVAAAVELLIEAVPGISSSASVADITVTAASALHNVFIYGLQNCTVEETTADAGYDTALADLSEEYDDWYFVTIDSGSEANIAAVATWVSDYASTSKKLFFACSDSSGERAGTGSIGSDLVTAANGRTVLFWSSYPHQFPQVRWAVVGGVQDPGSITYKYKTLVGASVDALTTTQKSNLSTDNWNFLQSLRSVSWAGEGKVADGEWIDIVHGIDAVEARIQEAVYGLFVNAPKVPHTQKGYDSIANAVLGVLKTFEGTPDQPGLLVAGSSRVILPAASTITANDRSTRQLRNVRFSADLEGAIHSASLVGVLSV